MAGIIYQFNDNLLQAIGLSTVDATGALVLLDGSATVQVTLKDASDVDIVGESWPQPLSYTGTLGKFQGVLRDTLTLPAPDASVFAHLLIDNGADQRGFLIGELIVQGRTF